MGRDVAGAGVSAEQVAELSGRLSRIADIRLPHALSAKGDAVTQQEKAEYLALLLRRDPAVFLERYVSLLSADELHAFDHLAGDYVISWHLQAAKASQFPSEEHRAHRAASVVRNRRYAFMMRLIKDGEYFSEDSMRLRAPALHLEFMGPGVPHAGLPASGPHTGLPVRGDLEGGVRSGPPSRPARAVQRPGERIWETLLRQTDEVDALREMERAQLAELEQFEEEEEEEDDDDAAGEIEAEEKGDGGEFEERGSEVNRDGARRRALGGSSVPDATAGGPAGEDGGGASTAPDLRPSPGCEQTGAGASKRQMGSSSTGGGTGAGARGVGLLVENAGACGSEPGPCEQGAAGEAWDAGLSGGDSAAQPGDTGLSGGASAAQARDGEHPGLAEFQRVMEERFMSGDDKLHVDYSAIDSDVTLDDDWLQEMGRDAEEKYFEED